MKGGGLCDKVGSAASASPIMLRSMRNSFGTDAMTGLTFLATGLYFFFVTTPLRVTIIGCSLKVERGAARSVILVGINTGESVEDKCASIGMLVH